MEKTIARDNASLNLCSLFDKERECINSGETTSNFSVTSIDETMPRAKRKGPKGPGKKSKEKETPNGKGGGKDGKAKTPKDVDKQGGGKGGGRSGGKRPSLPANSPEKEKGYDTSDTEESESSSDEEAEKVVNKGKSNAMTKMILMRILKMKKECQIKRMGKRMGAGRRNHQ